MLQDFLSNRPSIQSAEGTNAPARSGAFQPLFAERAAGLATRPRELATDPDGKPNEAPQIELVREDGEVRQIVVTCTCCEKITIDLEY